MENKKIDSGSILRFIMDGSDVSFIDNTKNKLCINDYNLAVTLFHTGAKLLSVERDNSGKHVFVFKKICNIESVADDFFDDSLTVKSFSFLKSIKTFNETIDKHLNNK